MKIYSSTNIGRVRSVNEDSYGVFSPHVFIVADGMGGHAAGEIASRIMVEEARHFLENRPSIDLSLIRETIFSANRKIITEANTYAEGRGMGTTVTVLHIDGMRGLWSHVGDSRLYLFSGNNLSQVTEDHSYVWQLVKEGALTPQEAATHPKKNIITRAVGVKKDIEIDSGEFELHPEDRFLLATDGLTNMVGEATLKEILSSDGDIAANLVEAALDNGGLDNVTAIVGVL